VIATISPELQADREVVLAAVRQDWRVLESVAETFRADRDVVLEAVRQDGWALEWASEALRADRGVVLEAVARTGDALRFAPARLCADREIALAAVRSTGTVLSMVAPEIQDLELVWAAVQSDIRALSFVEERLHEPLRKKLGFNHIPAWNKRQAPQAGASGKGDGPARWVLPDLKKFYDILGVPESASPEVIKKEYRKLALRHHPDKHPDDPEKAKRMFQIVNTAYQQIKEALRF